MKIGLCCLASIFILLVTINRSAEAFAPSLHHQQRTTNTRTTTTRFPSSPIQQQPQSTTQLSLSLADNDLTKYFLQTLISNGVPAVCTILVIAFAASSFRNKSNSEQRLGKTNAVMDLYSDLYENGPTNNKGGMLKGLLGGGSNNNDKAIQNLGVPSQQFIKIENVNSKFDSYQYSMTAATQSKAAAAAQQRQRNFDRALSASMPDDLDAYNKAQLIQAEQVFLKQGSQLMDTITTIQAELTNSAVDDKLKSLGVRYLEDLVDPAPVNTTTLEAKHKSNGFHMPGKNKDAPLFKELQAAQKQLAKLELNFVKDVIAAVGPERATAVRAALVADTATRGLGGLLTSLQDRPLSSLLGDDSNRPKSLFVTKFPGDVSASQVEELRQEVTAIVRAAKPGDEALLVLQSGGGTVTGYGLAAGQLQRFKQAGMKLTVAVEQVAASGGYMMCCVADRIVASPFAVLGSIGVISDMPNVYERLKQEGVEFQTVTAGKYKRTLTPTKKVTKQDLDKSKEDVEDILNLFKSFVHENRPSLDIENVATGETWFGSDAVEKGLCDEITAVDDVICSHVDQGYNVFEVSYAPENQQPSLSKLLPVGASSSSDSSGLIGKAVRWLVQTVAAEIKSELGGDGIEQKYMMKDDPQDRFRM